MILVTHRSKFLQRVHGTIVLNRIPGVVPGVNDSLDFWPLARNHRTQIEYHHTGSTRANTRSTDHCSTNMELFIDSRVYSSF